MNRVVLVGSLVRPAHHRTPRVQRDYWVISLRTDGEPGVQYHNIKLSLDPVVGERLAAVLPGSTLRVEGSLTYERWEDENGKIRTAACVLASEFQVLEPPSPQEES